MRQNLGAEEFDSRFHFAVGVGIGANDPDGLLFLKTEES